jgi:hypothetical protein
MGSVAYRLGYAALVSVGVSELAVFRGVDTVEQPLVGGGILHYNIGFAVGSQDYGATGVAQAVNHVGGTALEFGHGANVFGDIKHCAVGYPSHRIFIEFDVSMSACVIPWGMKVLQDYFGALCYVLV